MPHFVQINQLTYSFGSVGQGEERYFSFFLKPLSGSPTILDISVQAQNGIHLLSTAETAARGGIGCAGVLDRFCVVVVRVDTSSVGTKALTFNVRYADLATPANTRVLGPITTSATVQGTPVIEKNRFRTVTFSNRATAAGLTPLQYLQGQMQKNSPSTFRSDDPLLFDYYDNADGNPGNPVVWKQNWANSVFDFTGSCFDSYRWGQPLPPGQAAPDSTGCVAITRCHVISAYHYPRYSGVNLYGKDGNGGWIPMAIDPTHPSGFACRKLPSFDSLVCRIEQCLPQHVKVYPLVSPGEPIFNTQVGTSPINGSPYINNHYSTVLGIRRISLAAINYITPDVTGGGYNTSPLVAPFPFMQTPAVNGDSGSPSFLFFEGELAVMSTFTAPGAGPSFSSARFQQELQQAIQQIPAP